MSEAPTITTRHSSLITHHSPEGVPFLAFAGLADAPGLAHGVSTRAGGVSEGPYGTLNVSLVVGDDRAHVLENRARLARALGAEPRQLYSCRQVHGTSWRVVDADTTPAD